MNEFKAPTKRYDQARIQDPGHIYIPKLVRERLDVHVGDYVEIMVNEEDKQLLIQAQ